jgi:hypothetical protein
MHSPSGSNNPAADMIVKRLVAAWALLWLGAALAACSPFAGYMADHVPHWAGGLPPDAPPRPGAPGYDEFIAHGEPAATTPPPAAGATTGAVPAASAATATPPSAKGQNGKVRVGRVQSAAAPANIKQENGQQENVQREAPAAPAEPVENPSAEDTSVVRGGLY